MVLDSWDEEWGKCQECQYSKNCITAIEFVLVVGFFYSDSEIYMLLKFFFS